MIVHVEGGTAAAVPQPGPPVPHHDLTQGTRTPAVLLVALPVGEAGPEGRAGACRGLRVLLPDQSVPCWAGAAGELSVTFLSVSISMIFFTQKTSSD